MIFRWNRCFVNASGKAATDGVAGLSARSGAIPGMSFDGLA
jgi:hypothetical protein